MQGVIYERNDSPKQSQRRSTQVDAAIGTEGTVEKLVRYFKGVFGHLTPGLNFGIPS